MLHRLLFKPSISLHTYFKLNFLIYISYLNWLNLNFIQADKYSFRESMLAFLITSLIRKKNNFYVSLRTISFLRET